MLDTFYSSLLFKWLSSLLSESRHMFSVLKLNRINPEKAGVGGGGGWKLFLGFLSFAVLTMQQCQFSATENGTQTGGPMTETSIAAWLET